MSNGIIIGLGLLLACGLLARAIYMQGRDHGRSKEALDNANEVLKDVEKATSVRERLRTDAEYRDKLRDDFTRE